MWNMKIKARLYFLVSIILFNVLAGCGGVDSAAFGGSAAGTCGGFPGFFAGSSGNLGEAGKAFGEALGKGEAPGVGILAEETLSQEAETAPGETASGEETAPGATASGEEAPVLTAEIQSCLASMTLEEKVAQLFVVLPEALVGQAGTVTAAGSATREAFWDIPVGGLIYMGNNLRSEEQIREMLANVQAFSQERTGLPVFLCVDEEGGTVARINGKGIVDGPVIGNMSGVAGEGGRERAYEIGTQMGTYLSGLGFNLDFAPVADVWSNPENTVVRKRSFGSDPGQVSELALAVSQGLMEQDVLSCFKHFPGHGATAGDTHAGYAYTDKTLEELKECELIPFAEGIRKEVPLIMVGHISLPQVTGDDTPASLSYSVITELLREDMGYDGLVVTDALNMGAIVQQYSSAQAAVMTLQAGADLILMPKDFLAAYEGVLQAVEDGTLSEERIDRSLERILRVKLAMK